MGLAAFQISTGRAIEYQEHATPGTLVENAIIAGYDRNDVEERASSLPDFMAAVPKPPPTAEEQELARLRQAARDRTLTDQDKDLALKLLLDRIQGSRPSP